MSKRKNHNGPSAYFSDERGSLRAGWCAVRNFNMGRLAPLQL